MDESIEVMPSLQAVNWLVLRCPVLQRKSWFLCSADANGGLVGRSPLARDLFSLYFVPIFPASIGRFCHSRRPQQTCTTTCHLRGGLSIRGDVSAAQETILLSRHSVRCPTSWPHNPTRFHPRFFLNTAAQSAEDHGVGVSNVFHATPAREDVP